MRGSYKRKKGQKSFQCSCIRCWQDSCWMFCGGPLDSDVIRAPRDVLIAPFNHQDVLSFLLQLVGHIIETVTQVFHQDLLTGHFGSVHSNQEHVPPCGDMRKYMVKFWQIIGTDCMFDANNPPKSNKKYSQIFLAHTCFTTVHTESVLLSYESLVESQALGNYTAGVGAGPSWRCLLAGCHTAGHGVNQN